MVSYARNICVQSTGKRTGYKDDECQRVLFEIGRLLDHYHQLCLIDLYVLRTCTNNYNSYLGSLVECQAKLPVNVINKSLALPNPNIVPHQAKERFDP